MEMRVKAPDVATQAFEAPAFSTDCISGSWLVAALAWGHKERY